MTTVVVETQGLGKSFGAVRALDDLNLQVTAGEVHGFLGPNGAGKSTALRVLLGVLRHDSGTARVLGADPWRDAVQLHRRMAYVPGDVELWPNLTGGEAIDLLGRLRGSVNAARHAELIERFHLDPRRRGRTYSKGNRQKVALIAALASDADLLLLDEPTSGLDPLMEAVFQDEIRAARDRGVTILLSSHILSQVEALADRISIIRTGTIVETGTLADMRHLARSEVTVVTDRPADALLTHAGVHHPRWDGDRLLVDVDAAHLPTVMSELAALGIRALSVTPPSLEQLLLRHYSTGEQR